MRPYLAIPLLTGMTHLIGSAFLFGIVGGPTAILASPILAIFGWFFLVPEAIVVATQWHLLRSSRWTVCWRVWILTVPASTIAMAMLGPKELGNQLQWAYGYAFGTFAASTCSLLAVRLAKFLGVTSDPHTEDELSVVSPP